MEARATVNRLPPPITTKWVGRADLANALRALRVFSKDPNRTDMVGQFIGSLTGPSADRLFTKVWNDPVGRVLLEECRDLSKALGDRAYLSSLPAGTLGREYFEWTAARDLSADGIADAISRQVPRPLDGPRSTMAARIVDMHDLWHLLNGWDTDIQGEVHLLGYSYAQLGAYAWLSLAILTSVGLALTGRYEGLGHLRHAIRRGRKAALLTAVDWEAMLPLPLGEVRRRLGIEEPVAYKKMSFEEFYSMRNKSPVYAFLQKVLPQ